MKKITMICLVVLTMACKKKEKDPEYTVTFTSYSKGYPYLIKYMDENREWFVDSIRTNNYTKTITQSKRGFQFDFIIENGKQIMNDSLYAKIQIGADYKEDGYKFTNTNLNANASVDVQLTSPF